MRRVNSKGIGLLLTATMLIATHLSMGGRVICVGPDGHVAIEASDWRGTCADSNPKDLLSCSLIPSTHCGTCLDFEITIDRAPKVGGKTIELPVLSRADLIVPLASIIPFKRLSHLPPTSHIPPGHLAQNAVLII